MILLRKEGPAWPRVLVPATGAAPPARPVVAQERTLHVALQTAFEPQTALHDALRELSTEYVSVSWPQLGDRAQSHILDAARSIQPTFVFMQLQNPKAMDVATLRELRSLAPDAVIVNWDGDQHFEPDDPERAWFVQLGMICDASLVTNTEHPERYAELGVRHPGYLQIGVSPGYAPTPSTVDVPAIAFLGSGYNSNPAYARRRGIVAALAVDFPNDFCAYGGHWQAPIPCQPTLRQHKEPIVYTAARCAISMSIRDDLERYSSDRLFRALGSGAVTLVEYFPGADALGLQHERNCYFWSNYGELFSLIHMILSRPDQDFAGMRKAAAALVHELHTWHARMPELVAIIEAVRAAT